ncbi:GNAT family acetyltransferase [Pedobacter lusitanus]|uniref:GNAT family acetyltransferase n=1 Tax=Pedobacter lusitanus TaxID=1503925 RepID=A0A0D0GN81_9SPHI|nr:GNAT family N-acetyltransferase [Pedobacter lusitanus]KIO75866.1 GNAT family acetyltransferase [Pedobacter lusitanus]
METQFEIKTSTAAETEQIIDLILTIQRQEFNIPITAEDQPDLREIDEFYKEPGGEFWIAKHNDQVIGSIALINIGEGIGVIRKMFVHKDYRGKEKGIAQQLLERLIAYAAAKGINAIYLGTVQILKAAIRFYERNGFVSVEKANLPAAMPLMKLDTHFFVLHLNNEQ